MKKGITFIHLRTMLAWLTMALFIQLPAYAETTYSYDFQWYSGAQQTWVYDAAPMLTVDVYEDLSTPENDVFFKFYNNINTELGYLSSLDYIQIDAGTVTADMFTDLSIWDSSPVVFFNITTPGTPLTLIDLAAPSISWDGDYATGKIKDSAPSIDGVNPGEFVTYRAILSDGLQLSDVINAMNAGMVTTYVDNGPTIDWTSSEMASYRAGASAGLRFALLVRSVVPNEWHPDGHGLFMSNALINVNDNVLPEITTLIANPANIIDTETSMLTIVAYDPDSQPNVLSYQWSVISGGGTFDDATSATPIYTPEDIVGTRPVILRVDISDGSPLIVSGELILQISDADAPPPGTELLIEDFVSSDLNDWSVWDEGTRTSPSNWQVKSGELAQLSNIWDGRSSSTLPNIGTYLVYDHGLGWLDYRVNFNMRSEDNDTLGLMFRYIDSNNYYRFSWDSQSGQRRLVKNDNSVFTLLASDNVSYVLGQSYRVEILAQGNILEVLVDGVLIFQVNDNIHSQGSIAFYTWFNNGAYFDNVSIGDLSGGVFNVFPQILTMIATPDNILDTEISTLTAVAYDPDSSPNALSYQWSVVSGGGTLDDATSATPIYTPEDIVGTQIVTLRVDVSDGADIVSDELSLQVSDVDSPPPGMEILFEDFTSGDLSGWSVLNGGTRTGPAKWQIKSGELVQLSNIWDGSRSSTLPKLGTHLLYDYGLGWLDYRVNFNMRSEDNDTLGLMFRYIDSNNYYRFSWDSQRSQRRLVKNVNGVFTLLAEDNTSYIKGQTYNVEILAQGNQLEVWIDGMLIFQVNDNDHQQGSIAFYSWFNTGSYFDNISVEDLSGGAFNFFPQINSLIAAPLNILDTETSALEVVAYDPDNSPNILSYQWSVISGGGTLDDNTSATPVYFPVNIVGTQIVTLRVVVTDGADTVSDELTLQVSDADAPPPGPEILFEDFTSGDLSDWSVLNGGTRTAPSNWKIKSGELVQLSNIWDGGRSNSLPKLGTHLLYNLGLVWPDYRVNFVMRSEDNDTLGIMFRYVDSNNYYRFSWDSQRSQRRLMKNENGVFTLLAEDNVPYVLSQSYQIEVLAQGNQLEVWIDGALVFQVNDSTHQQGSIAFYSWFNTGAYFDNVSVEDRSGF